MEILNIFGDTLGGKLIGVGIIVLLIAGISMGKGGKGGSGGGGNSSTPQQ